MTNEKGEDEKSKEDMTMAANLIVVVRNNQPRREEIYPRAWLLYRKGHSAVELEVVHDSNRRPHVLEKSTTIPVVSCESESQLDAQRATK